VRSPTFTLVAAYPTRPRLVHVDLYRLESPAAVDDLGLEDLAGEEPAVVAVEWPDLLADRPAREPVLEVEIMPEHEGRRIRVSASTASAEYLLQGMGGP
jgi:tRNA threonylcarbamoyladenosine biosynthesis protein TsaE